MKRVWTERMAWIRGVPMARIERRRSILLILLPVLLAGCAGVPVEPESRGLPGVIRGEEYVVHTAVAGDTWDTLAAAYLRDGGRGWVIADFNGSGDVEPGRQVVIPLVHPNPVGVQVSGYQTLAILCYHRFGPNRSKMVVTPEDFEAQMAYLRAHGYRVVPLSDVHGFLKGETALPHRAVAITIDDGYRSAYDVAYPVLRKYGFPATFFVYSNFIGARDALGWKEMKEMAASGLVDIQPHSKTHASLTRRLAGEGDEAYRRRVDEELRAPGQQIGKALGLPLHTFAYPYGDNNDVVVERARHAGYGAGVTVSAGGNPAFGHPFRLRRTMIYGTRDMNAFIGSLRVFTEENLK